MSSGSLQRLLRWLGVALLGVVVLLGLAWALLPGMKVDPIRPVESQARRLRAAILRWQTAHDTDRCPDVRSLRSEGFLGVSDPDRDPWGSPFTFTCQSDVTVVSIGPDRIAGTLDDLAVPRGFVGRKRPGMSTDAGEPR
jgi:hypothetical protein